MSANKKTRSLWGSRSEAQRIYYQRQTIKRLEQENEKLKQELLKLEDKYIHNVPCCNEEDCEFYKKYKENETDLTTVYLKGYEDGKEKYNHYKLLYQKVKDHNDLGLKKIQELKENAKSEITTLTTGDKAYYKYVNNIFKELEDILKDNNEVSNEENRKKY